MIDKRIRWLLIVIIVLTFTLRLPTLFEPHWYFDEGIYALAGSQWFQGSRLYVDIWDHKPPGIFIIYGICYNLAKLSSLGILFWAKLAAGLAVISTQIALFKISQKLTRIPLLTLLAPALYGLLSSLPFWEGYLANGEIFMVALSIWGIYVILKNPNLYFSNVFGGGFLIGLAILIKPVALAEGFLITIFILTKLEGKKTKRLAWFLAGLLAPLAITSAYFILIGNFAQFIESSILYNLKYTTGTVYPLEQELVLTVVRAISLITLVWIFWRSNLSRSRLILSWFILDVLTVTLSLRPYIHYLIQLFPPLCLLTVASLNQLISSRKKQGLLISSSVVLYTYGLLVIIALNQKLKFTTEIPYQFNQLAYWQNYLDAATGHIEQSEYLEFFGHGVKTNNQIASFVKRATNQVSPHKDQTGTVFIWGGGEAPWLYYELSSLGFNPATRFTNYYHAEVKQGEFGETASKITAVLPDLIIVFPNSPRFDVLEKLTSEKYWRFGQINNVKLFSRT